MKDNGDKLLLCGLFVFTVMTTLFLEGAHKDDSVIVNWGMQLAGPIEGAILTLIIGKARETGTTNTGPTTNVIASPDVPTPVTVNANTTASGDVKPSTQKEP